MSTEERIYRGNCIQGLIQTVDRVRGNPLRYYIMQNSAGTCSYGPSEMLASEADERNMRLAEIGSDYRWCFVPDRGKR